MNKKRYLMILALAVMAVAMVATSLFAGSSVPPDWPSRLVFGVIPTDSSDNVMERNDSLVRYLQKRLGVPVEIKTATDYAGVITGMQFKHIDFAYFGPKSYVEAAKRANAEAFAVELSRDGAAGYYGVIITRKGSGLKNMKDIRGKVWAFTDPNSTSGTLVPMVYFYKELKMDPEKYFSKVIYSGSHEASMLAVKNGKVDAASTNDIDMARGDGKRWKVNEDFEIIWKSKLIPASPIAYRKDIPASLKKALKDAFLAYDDPVGLDKLKLKGYVEGSDGLFDPIRDQMEVKAALTRKN
ncbi:MAG: Phosphate-import protein PhnD precursor [Syntrophaceae bacterium PtaU1.Bin231]|nr:MAG: Phosphate-import protein PhnD precursor [Syntrophaceae bacterium PtaU1.Bin231]HOG16671.1 phosphonate ABC transporter substrate-binding protein [Syntrophales bacterium]